MAEEMEEVKVPYRNSRLFSRDFLAERLPGSADWKISPEELKSIRTRLRDLFAQALPTTSEAALEEELIRPILSEILGFSYLVQPSRKIFKTHRQPDYALFPDEETKQAAKEFDGEKKLFAHALAVADAKAWDVDLDAVGPASQMHDYILLSGVRWGVITNGRRWRLYHRDTVHELDTFYEVDLESIITADDPEPLKYFLLFFRAKSFLQDGFLDRALTESVEYARRIGTELKENVFEALRLLCQGFLDGNGSLGPDDLSEIHANALILLYRLLFLLYAESEREQELLPLSNPAYRDQIGLSAIKREVATHDNWLKESHTLWSRLKDLFRFIHRGSAELGIYEYNGGLFDPARYPFLEHYQIGDSFLAEVLRLLTCTEENGRLGFLDYATLDVRELGSIYEGLLEHRLILQDGVLTWEEDRSERKKTGSYYTPEYIVSYIVENTVGPLVDEIEQKLREELASLDEKIRRARGENRRLLQEERSNILAGARERVLNLKVLDPAMGSGHFLVSACDYLARRIAGLEAALTGKEIEEAVPALKRTVAVRSLYGVDLNPLATELAKLSLWLHTVAKGKPLSFLDHHLRTGNSLIGATVNDLKRPPSGKSFEIGLWESRLVEDLSKAIRHLALIKESVSASRSDIEAKKEEWELVNAWIGKYKQAADVWLSPHFGNKLTDEDYPQVIEAAAENKIDKVANRPFFVRAPEIAARKRFFHWELEFPDVFFDRFGRPLDNPGFDAVIGNPPYDVISEKEQQRKVKEEKLFFNSSQVFEIAIGNKLNLYRLFIALAIHLLRRGGQHGFIVPMALLGDSQARSLRENLVKHTRLRFVEAFPQKDDPHDRVFFDAKLSTCIYILENSDPYKFVVRIHPGKHILESLPCILISIKELKQFDPNNLSIPCYPTMTAADFRLALKITTASSGINLGQIAPSQQGEVNLTTHSRFLNDKPVGPLVLRGAHINRYLFNDSPKQGEPKYLYVEEFLNAHGTKTKAFDFRRIRIGYQRGAAIDNWRRIIATIIDPGNFCSDTINYIAQTKSLTLFTILAFLNSSLWEWRFRLTSTTNHVNSYEIDAMLIPRITFTTSKKERARLVEEGKRLYFEALNRLNLEDE